jgi:beta-glucosidase
MNITFTLDDSDLSIWDSTIHDWKLVSGRFAVYIGASSLQTRLTGSFSIN